MKKILVFGITDKPGGVESVIMNYYRHIDRSKVQFDFLCNTKTVAYEQEINELGGNIYRLTARSENRKQFYHELNEFMKQYAKQYECIWVNVCSLANIDYLKYAKKYGIQRRIIHAHNSQNMDSKLRGLLHYANKQIIDRYATDFWSCSEEASIFFYKNSIIRSSKYRLVNNAIDLNKFAFDETVRNQYRNQLHLDNNTVILNVGRFHFQKNQLYLIDIFEEYQKRNKDSLLIITGMGEDEQKLRKYVEDKSLTDKVIFLIERSDVNNILMASDIFVFPSLFEGFPLTLVEAQASGIPILCSSSITEKVKMSNNISFISINEPASTWADAIERTNTTRQSEQNIITIRRNGFDIDTEAKKIEGFVINGK